MICLILVMTQHCAYAQVEGDVTYVGPSSAPDPVSVAALQKVGNLANNMTSRWAVLDAQCSPLAVFALTYLYMTHGAMQMIANLYFDNGDDMADFVVTFATRYITAFDNWASGDLEGVSDPWIVYFNNALSNMSTVSQNLELGMNAHINYDLAIATVIAGYAVPCKKPDYDRVNDLMSDIIYNLTVDLSDRYDSSLAPGGINDVEDYATLQLIIGWRENALVDAVSYYNALTEGEQQVLQDINEGEATTGADAIALENLENTYTSRKEYCEANHAPSRV